MKAVYFLGDRKLEVGETPDPAPGLGEVILEIKASGMCASDLKYCRAAAGADSIGLSKKSDKPVIAGRELCGGVARVGKGGLESSRQGRHARDEAPFARG